MRASRGLSFTSAIVVGLGAIALLGACTPDETEPTPSASPTAEEPTPTPTPTTPPEALAPERPAEMAEISVAGAEAAATYFLELYPYAYATNDLTEWRALSHPECGFCNSVISNVEEQVVAGTVSLGGLHIDQLYAATISPSRFAVNAVVTESPSVEVAGDGSVVSELPTSKTYDVVFALQRGDTEWIVLEIDATEVVEQ
ncbi:DUF6318 family protein [Actinotalea solisilvae]|uniref:DUF6318 family protein n=1 Tax=Actinotalea solisilvae TaxID=2072922 RepID=UPI0018F20F6F|nr:DUF6318 family protein [Actinotalea solisilvae]